MVVVGGGLAGGGEGGGVEVGGRGRGGHLQGILEATWLRESALMLYHLQADGSGIDKERVVVMQQKVVDRLKRVTKGRRFTNFQYHYYYRGGRRWSSGQVLQKVHVELVTAVEALPAHRASQVEVALALASVADHVVGEREHLAAVPALEAAAGQFPRTVPQGQCRWLEGHAGWGLVRHTQWQVRSHCGAENTSVSVKHSRCGQAIITEQKTPVSA